MNTSLKSFDDWINWVFQISAKRDFAFRDSPFTPLRIYPQYFNSNIRAAHSRLIQFITEIIGSDLPAIKLDFNLEKSRQK